jgi:hypothetical protein
MSCLHACPSCARHVRSSETSCPFCDATLSGKCELPHAPSLGRVSSRAVLSFFAATAALSACGKSTKVDDPKPVIEDHPTVTVYGPPPVMIDASPPMPMVTDAGKDGKDAAK